MIQCIGKAASVRFVGLQLILAAVFLFGTGMCEESFALSGGKRPADLSRLVIVGDSLSAGVQNFSLHEDFQPNSYAALIARQAGAELPLPLIARPGVPQPMTLVSPGPPPVVVQPFGIPCLLPDTGVFTCRRDPFSQPYNISVPNLKIDEVLNYRPNCVPDPFVGGIRLVDLYVETVLGFPGCLRGQFRSEIEMAEALQPTFAILWIGSNDTLWAVVNGVTSEITDAGVFRAVYEESVQRLVATGAEIVIGNLPDVTLLPFLSSAEDVAAMLGLPLAIIGPVLGIGPGDFVTLPGLQHLQEHGAGPLADPYVVTADENETIQAAGLLFNAIVYEVAARHNIPVVDVRGLVQEVYEKGIVIGGQRLTLGYLGGLFTLDGFHPTNTGHALVANKFIKTINRYFDLSLAQVDVEAIKEADPLVLPGIGHPPGQDP